MESTGNSAREPWDLKSKRRANLSQMWGESFRHITIEKVTDTVRSLRMSDANTHRLYPSSLAIHVSVSGWFVMESIHVIKLMHSGPSIWMWPLWIFASYHVQFSRRSS